MAESTQPTQVVYLERPPSSSSACGLAPGTHSRPPEPFCHAERLNEEPDRGKPFVRFCEGLRYNWCMGEILWHRRETRRQTENTNVTPTAPEDLSLLDKYSNSRFYWRLRFEHRPRFGLSSTRLSPILSVKRDGKAEGEAMDWKHLLAYITGTVDQELLLRNEYLV